MDFYIKKNSTLPRLYVEFTQTGYDVTANDFINRLENADMVFSMQEYSSCIPKIICSPAKLVEYNKCPDGDCKKYYIEYSFTKKQTSKTGKYKGIFKITFLDNQEVLIAPIRNELVIHVVE